MCIRDFQISDEVHTTDCLLQQVNAFLIALISRCNLDSRRIYTKFSIPCCRCCGIPILPKSGEKISAVQSRLYCSQRHYWNSKKGKFGSRRLDSPDELTKGEVYGYKRRTKDCARGIIRQNACKRLEQSGRRYECVNCGAKNHLQVCHLQGVHTFLGDVPLFVINALWNITYLCKDCHLEFDKGLNRDKIIEATKKAYAATLAKRDNDLKRLLPDRIFLERVGNTWQVSYNFSLIGYRPKMGVDMV